MRLLIFYTCCNLSACRLSMSSIVSDRNPPLLACFSWFVITQMSEGELTPAQKKRIEPERVKGSSTEAPGTWTGILAQK